MSENVPTRGDWELALGGRGDTYFLLKHVPALLAEVERLEKQDKDWQDYFKTPEPELARLRERVAAAEKEVAKHELAWSKILGPADCGEV